MKPNMPNNQMNGGNQMPSNNGQIQIQMNPGQINSSQVNSGPVNPPQMNVPQMNVPQMNAVPEQMNKSANNITDDFNNLVGAKQESAIEKSNESSVISSVSSAELSSSDSSDDDDDEDDNDNNDDNENGNNNGANVNEVKKGVQQKNNGTKKVEEFKVAQNETVQTPVKTWNQFFINMGVLFALFFLFSSKQVESGLNAIPYLKDIPFMEQINLLSRGLLMVLIYVVLDKFVL